MYLILEIHLYQVSSIFPQFPTPETPQQLQTAWN